MGGGVGCGCPLDTRSVSGNTWRDGGQTHHWTRNRARTCAGNFSDGSAAHLHSPALQRTIKMADDYGVNDYRDVLASTHTNTHISTGHFLFFYIHQSRWAGFYTDAPTLAEGSHCPGFTKSNRPTRPLLSGRGKRRATRRRQHFSFVLFLEGAAGCTQHSRANKRKKPRKGSAILYSVRERAICTLLVGPRDDGEPTTKRERKKERFCLLKLFISLLWGGGGRVNNLYISFWGGGGEGKAGKAWQARPLEYLFGFGLGGTKNPKNQPTNQTIF